MLIVADQNLSAAVLNIAVLVFREGLECILVVSVVTAGLKGTDRTYRRPIALGVGVGTLPPRGSRGALPFAFSTISAKIYPH